MENSIIQTIIKRRSTRAFKEEQLKKEEIDLIIQGYMLRVQSATVSGEVRFTSKHTGGRKIGL